MPSRKRVPIDDQEKNIKKSKNRYNQWHKTKIDPSDTDYSLGNKSPYQEYRDNNGGFDPINPDDFQASSQPWAQIKMTDTIDARWRAFNKLLPTLKGRQRDVAYWLLEGIFSQAEIARKIGIDARDMNDILKALQKKIERGTL